MRQMSKRIAEIQMDKILIDTCTKHITLLTLIRCAS